MKTITYSLKVNEIDSDNYYKDAGKAAEIVAAEGIQVLSQSISGFKGYIEKNRLEAVRSDEEYMLELLTLGVLWLRYSDDAAVLNQISKQVLTELVSLRQKGGSMKPGADFLRGILGTFVLHAEHRPELVCVLEFSVKNFNNLIQWLAATGEFSQEVKRLDNWLSYIEELNEEEASDLLAESVYFAMWFEEESLKHVGKYTDNVESYLETVGERHRWREDLIFCSRQRLEYHLNMVGAEVMNKAYRKDFINSERKAILLPACIRKKLKGGCRAENVEGVLYCAGCDPKCQVYKISRLAERNDYQVLIIPHESTAFTDNKMKSGGLGVIGVACVLNLLAGGWKAKSLGIPAQCVLLDYCGCRNHWDEEGFTTEINMDRLQEIMKY
ncbi:MAG: DUF116 domain-containing protein [Bacillota bacterium]